jgi:hypothetical protein
MGQGAKAREVFRNELAMISDGTTRDFVAEVFERFGQDSWWSRACSLSGKYHPLLAQNIGVDNGFAGGVGGLVRHVKFGVWNLQELFRAHLGDPKCNFTPQELKLMDVMTAAMILHDLMKDGDPELAREPERLGNKGKSLITGCHGVDLANAIWNRMLGRQGSAEQILICYGIAGHMGKWTLPAEYQPSRFENPVARFVGSMVHEADYVASRQSDVYMLGVMHQMGLIHPDQYRSVMDIQQAGRPASRAA